MVSRLFAVMNEGGGRYVGKGSTPVVRGTLPNLEPKLKCEIGQIIEPRHLWSSGQSFWLQIQRSRVRFPALPDFLSSSGSGTGSTQPREVN